MTLLAAELESLAAAVYGARWQSRLARDMGLALRTVQRWARDGIGKPATAQGVRRFLEERRIARIPAPPAGTTSLEDRDDACRDALEPAVLATLAAAEDIGWDRAEALAAAFALILDEMIALAGVSATAVTLRQALAEMSPGGERRR